jgi:hypothetical protein
MNDPSVITSEERHKAKNFVKKCIISDSHEQFLGTSLLTIDISKKEQGIVIKIKKLFTKQA